MKLYEIVNYLEELFPPQLQESYDNSGLITGNLQNEIKAILLSLDITETVLEEAEQKGCNLVISHHPPVFQGLKRFTGGSAAERVVLKSIRSDLAMYAAHTNLDNVGNGLNARLCQKLGIGKVKILNPLTGQLRKLITFVPAVHAEEVRTAIFTAGAGHIGEYDMCSFNSEGTGTFRGKERSSPYIGRKGEIHYEPEVRIETIIPAFLEKDVIDSLLAAHPYEEVAYDIYPLENTWSQAGAGMTGELEKEMSEKDFLGHVKNALSAKILRHSGLTGRSIKKIAVCGGSGSAFIHYAISTKADAYISADFKYHQFYEAEGKILLIDAGHFETEQFALEIFYDILIKKLPNFAIHFSESGTNPVNYY